MMKYMLILLLIPILFSCEKDANIDIPVSEPQLVTACFLSPNSDSVFLKLTWSSPVFYTSDNNLNSESEATVVLSKGSTQYPLTWHSNTETYTSGNIDFITGDIVNLLIDYKDNKITAQCTIPSAPNYLMQYNGKTVEHYDYYDQNILNYRFTNKKPGKENYYRIIFEGFYTNIQYPSLYSQLLYVDQGELFSFAQNESVNFKISYYESEGEVLDSVRYYIISCDKDYYKYHKSIYNYQGDDFFVEPSIIYNNIEGGLGIFSSYNMATDTTIIN